MGAICDMICLEKEIDKNDVIMEDAIGHPVPSQKNSNINESKMDQNPTFDSKCNTYCHKSSLAQQTVQKDKQEQSIAYPDFSIHKQITYEAPVLDPTISIDKDHPFFHRKYGTEIKKPAVRNSLKIASEIERGNQLNRTFNDNNNCQKSQARYVTKSSI